MQKKALAFGLGALLAVSSAVPASAASQIDFSGFYRAYFSNVWNNQYDLSEDKTNWSGFYNRLQMDFAFHATDEVSVIWRLRAPASQMWGTGDSGMAAATVHAFGEVKQDWGTVSIGRLRADYFYTGLSNLGWRPKGAFGATDYTAVNPFDIADDEWEGIRYANRWDSGFQLVGQFNRLTTGQTFHDTTKPGHEEFTDFYLLEGAYFWDGGGASLGFHYLRDHAGIKDGDASGPRLIDGQALKVFYLNPALSHRWDSGFGFHFEGKAGWGTDDNIPSGAPNRKSNGYAFYLDLDYNYGPGNVNLAGWWASGDDGKDDKANDLVGMGRDFKPLIAAYGANNGRVGRAGSIGSQSIYGGAVAVANDRSGTGNGTGGFGKGDYSNHWVLALNGNHSLTDDITVTYALAKLALNKVQEGASKNIGFEADLGFQVQLLDNLRFGTGFGYLFAGKALKETPTSDKKAADSYTWLNTLTFSF